MDNLCPQKGDPQERHVKEPHLFPVGQKEWISGQKKPNKVGQCLGRKTEPGRVSFLLLLFTPWTLGESL